MTAACSDKDQEGKTFLQLKITYKHGEEINNLYLEMGLNQFYTFLHELEKSKSVIEFGNWYSLINVVKIVILMCKIEKLLIVIKIFRLINCLPKEWVK